ncbi:unnamed protein product [Ceutorhynchus assimilis]|uniref:SPARC-related modular calcium-binding protein 2 n=1 Tax=Ceutorhynchus assimilis TaxID=467358 RepID=A0A9N9MHR1_9CUCU|nr:unnamed protein product [Ceutorhynchus assimilis]
MRPSGFIFVLGFLWYHVVCLQVDICDPKSCRKPDDGNRKPVCGSDGLTYPDRCQLERVKCQNVNVTLVKRGPCKRQRSCLEWQDLSLDFPQYRFKARCKKNGAYESGQCHPESKYCWCVTPDGVPIGGTVKKLKNDTRPIRCAKKKLPRSSGGRPKSRAKVCKLTDKSHFNNNLINSFHSEFSRETRRSNATDQEVIGWKFRSLDVDQDRALDRKEYRDIKRLVGKAMRPKKCARSFPKACDVDSDGRVTAAEWAECLTRDGITVATTTDGTAKDDLDDYDAPYDPLPVPPHGVLDSVPPLANYDDDIPDSREEEQPPGCLGDRKTALEEGHDATYIPECTLDGRYKKVQCYKSVGYCWCVNEENGQNIPGTSVKGRAPDCDSFKPPPKPMKGCPDDKKIVFLNELMRFLQGKMTQGDSPTAPIQSKEDQALWSFNFLDKNKNKILERAEWKTFKEMVAPIKGLKKCGKKLPRYCDSDKNKEISTTEWLDCLNVQGLIAAQAISSDPRSGKTNPLSMLKDD